MAMTEEKKQIKKACVDVESIDAATALLSHGTMEVTFDQMKGTKAIRQ